MCFNVYLMYFFLGWKAYMIHMSFLTAKRHIFSVEGSGGNHC